MHIHSRIPSVSARSRILQMKKSNRSGSPIDLTVMQEIESCVHLVLIFRNDMHLSGICYHDYQIQILRVKLGFKVLKIANNTTRVPLKFWDNGIWVLDRIQTRQNSRIRKSANFFFFWNMYSCKQCFGSGICPDQSFFPDPNPLFFIGPESVEKITDPKG